MGEEKLKVEEILKRIDELIRILRFLSEDLTEISKSLKASLNVSVETQPFEHLPQPTSAQQTIVAKEPTVSLAPILPSEMRTADDVQRVFPQDLAGMLYIEVTDEYIFIKPRQYLGSDNFRRIASIIRDQLSGEYVSAGKDSHFRIPRKT